MTKVSDIIKVMEKFAPSELKEDFDNVGLLIGKEDREVKKVLLALDVDESVALEAIEFGADLIICHHPLIFDGLKSVAEKNFVERTVALLIENKIALYAMHTNLDIVKGGLNDLFAKKLGLKVKSALADDGCGRICSVKTTLSELAEKVKAEFFLPYIRYSGDGERVIKKVALCTGGGRSFVDDVIESGADVYISGDLHHADIRKLCFEGVDFINIDHYDSEKIVTEIFSEIMAKKFADIEIKVATEKHILSNVK